MKTALLLIAHGSRNPEANADLFWLAETLRVQGSYDVVEPAFLELASPTIPEGAARCVEQGVGRVLMVPYFLSPGVHARQDMEEYIASFRDRFREVEFELARPLGRHPLLVEIVQARAAEALRTAKE